MKHSLVAEEGIRNLDRILLGRAHSISSRRKSSNSSSVSRCPSNISSITTVSTPRSPLPVSFMDSFIIRQMGIMLIWFLDFIFMDYSKGIKLTLFKGKAISTRSLVLIDVDSVIVIYFSE